jgi:hypothetical protein
VILVDNDNKTFYTTQNNGLKIKRKISHFPINAIVFTDNPNIIGAYDQLNRQFYTSFNFGDGWTLVDTNLDIETIKISPKNNTICYLNNGSFYKKNLKSLKVQTLYDKTKVTAFKMVNDTIFLIVKDSDGSFNVLSSQNGSETFKSIKFDQNFNKTLNKITEIDIISNEDDLFIVLKYQNEQNEISNDLYCYRRSIFELLLRDVVYSSEESSIKHLIIDNIPSHLINKQTKTKTKNNSISTFLVKEMKLKKLGDDDYYFNLTMPFVSFSTQHKDLFSHIKRQNVILANGYGKIGLNFCIVILNNFDYF